MKKVERRRQMEKGEERGKKEEGGKVRRVRVRGKKKVEERWIEE